MIHVDLVLSKFRWLDTIGRSTRSSKNEKLENFLTDLQRLTIVHETDDDGHESYRFSKGQKDGNGNGNGESESGSEGKDEKGKKQEKGKGKETSSGAAEGDKTMSDDHGSKGDEEVKRDRDIQDQKEAKPKNKDGVEMAQGGKAEEREDEQVHQGGEEKQTD